MHESPAQCAWTSAETAHAHRCDPRRSTIPTEDCQAGHRWRWDFISDLSPPAAHPPGLVGGERSPFSRSGAKASHAARSGRPDPASGRPTSGHAPTRVLRRVILLDSLPGDVGALRALLPANWEVGTRLAAAHFAIAVLRSEADALAVVAQARSAAEAVLIVAPRESSARFMVALFDLGVDACARDSQPTLLAAQLIAMDRRLAYKPRPSPAGSFSRR
jgi:hypothetical protein